MTHWSDFVDPHAPVGAYLPWKKVEGRVGISRTTAWRLQKSGAFPKPYVVSPGRVAYRESEVEAWKASRAHRAAGPPVRRPRRASPSDAQVAAPASATAPERPFAPESREVGAPIVGDVTAAPARPRRRRRIDSRQISFEF